MAEYNSKYTGAQIDTAVGNALAPTLIKMGGTGATTAAKALENLGAAVKWDTLWQNASPSSGFEEQSLTIDGLAEYNLFMINFLRSLGADDYAKDNQTSELLFVPTDTIFYSYASQAYATSSYTPYITERRIYITKSTNTVRFGLGYYTNVYKATGSSTTKMMIPLYIFGSKI